MSKYVKLGVIVAIVACVLRIHPTFAADIAGTATSATTAVTGSSWMTQLLNAILKFLSWGWMLLAFLAGKLMSNDFVYGTFLHLDSALFKLWNYMKNIANFVLGFLFLFGILKSFFTKDAFEIQKILPRYLLAGVMIQMSWFMMGALIDLSNVATAAVGAFPTQFIQGSTEDMSKSKMMQLAVTVPVRIDVSFKENTPLFSTHEGTQTIEQMFGKFNDMSGPLLFMGAAIFRFQDYDIMNQDVSNWKNFSIGLFIKLFLLIAFTVPMFALIAINFIRMFRLRMRIAFAPLAAIARSFDDKMTPGFIKKLGDAEKSIGFGNFTDVLALIFQPVAMIGAISLAMILSIGIYYVLGGDPGDQKSGSEFNKQIEQIEVSAKDKSSTLKDNATGTEITIEGNLFKEMGNFVGGMIGYLIVTGFSVVLIWSLLKIGASFSRFTKTAATGIFSFSEKLVANSNIIPFGSAMTSFAALNKTKDQAVNSLASGSYANGKVDEQTNKLQASFYKTDIGKGVKNTFNISESSSNDISLTEQSKILQSASGGVDQILSTIRETVAQKNVTAQSKNFRESFSSIVNQNKEFKDFVLAGTGVSQEDFDANKNNLLGATNDVGAKMRKFVAYAVNSDVKKGSSISPTIVDEFVTKKLKTTAILPTTPFLVAKKG